MNHYKYEVKKDWRKSEIFQNDIITKGINEFNKIIQSKLHYSSECVYVDVYHPIGDSTKLCYVNDSLILEETREKLLKAGLIYKEEK